MRPPESPQGNERSWDLAILSLVLVLGLAFGLGRWVDTQMVVERAPASVVGVRLGPDPILDFGCLDAGNSIVRLRRVSDTMARIKISGKFCHIGGPARPMPEIRVIHMESRQGVPVFVRWRESAFITGSVSLMLGDNTFETSWIDRTGQKITTIARVSHDIGD